MPKERYAPCESSELYPDPQRCVHCRKKEWAVPAQQALIQFALSTTGGIYAFTTTIDRCIRPAIPEERAYPVAELILTPPATLKAVLIDEGMVINMLNEYKSHFSKELSKGAPIKRFILKANLQGSTFSFPWTQNPQRDTRSSFFAGRDISGSPPPTQLGEPVKVTHS